MNFHNGLKMNFPVVKLITALKKNRKEHAQIVKESKKDYLIALEEELSKKLKDLNNKKNVNPNSSLPIPGNNLDKYDTALKMLEFTQDKHIELSQDQFNCYVEDKWDWQKNFLDVASNYSASAVLKNSNR